MRKHFAALSPSDRSLFVATLLMLPVADAVAVVAVRWARIRRPAPASPVSADVPPADLPPTPALIAAGEAPRPHRVDVARKRR
jgi:hypothetical protein